MTFSGVTSKKFFWWSLHPSQELHRRSGVRPPFCHSMRGQPPLGIRWDKWAQLPCGKPATDQPHLQQSTKISCDCRWWFISPSVYIQCVLQTKPRSCPHDHWLALSTVCLLLRRTQTQPRDPNTRRAIKQKWSKTKAVRDIEVQQRSPGVMLKGLELWASINIFFILKVEGVQSKSEMKDFVCLLLRFVQ